MKKPIRIGLAMAFMLSLAFFSCKDKPAGENTDETQVETQIDNTDTQEPTGPPTNDTVPGVVSGAGDEQVP